MAWVDKTEYWDWVEDRPKDERGHPIPLLIPRVHHKKRLDYLFNCAPDHKVSYPLSNLLIGVWDEDEYTPVNRRYLEFIMVYMVRNPSLSPNDMCRKMIEVMSDPNSHYPRILSIHDKGHKHSPVTDGVDFVNVHTVYSMVSDDKPYEVSPLVIGEWKSGIYTPLNREELACRSIM